MYLITFTQNVMLLIQFMASVDPQNSCRGPRNYFILPYTFIYIDNLRLDIHIENEHP